MRNTSPRRARQAPRSLPSRPRADAVGAAAVALTFAALQALAPRRSSRRFLKPRRSRTLRNLAIAALGGLTLRQLSQQLESHREGSHGMPRTDAPPLPAPSEPRPREEANTPSPDTEEEEGFLEGPIASW